MDLNAAIKSAEDGAVIRDDTTMRVGWTVRYLPAEKLLWYFNPKGERAHRIKFSDAQRASYQWKIVDPADVPEAQPQPKKE